MSCVNDGIRKGSFVAPRMWPRATPGRLVAEDGDCYNVSAPLARGMWGDVFSACDRLRQPRAIKTLYTRTSWSAFRRVTSTQAEILQEIHALRAAHGSGAIHKAINAGDRVCIVVDLMHGDIAGLRGKLDFDCRRTLARLALAQLAGDLGRMHRCGQVHNDLHLGNILWRSDGVVAIADFGASSSIKRDATTRASQAPWLHAAPERFETAANGHTAQADVWSLGLAIADIHAVRWRPVDLWAMARLLWRYLWGVGPRALTRNVDPATRRVCLAQTAWRRKMLDADGQVCMERVGMLQGMTGDERKWARYYGALKAADAPLCRFVVQRVHDHDPLTRATPQQIKTWALAMEPPGADVERMVAGMNAVVCCRKRPSSRGKLPRHGAGTDSG